MKQTFKFLLKIMKQKNLNKGKFFKSKFERKTKQRGNERERKL